MAQALADTDRISSEAACKFTEKEVAAVAKALAHPARVRIIRLRASSPAKSNILVCYSLNPDRLVPLASLLNTIFEKDRRGELKGSICCPNQPAQ
jgi:ArsR family transcriptional regulator, arsenate/arsenite/antimonite-responsive transcriptional repressor